AVKYTPDGGGIEVRAQREGAEIIISTKDSGIGIAPELLPRIFAPFVQGAYAPHAYNTGLGIGLTLAKRLVEMHGGRLVVRSGGAREGGCFRARGAGWTEGGPRRRAPPAGPP